MSDQHDVSSRVGQRSRGRRVLGVLGVLQGRIVVVAGLVVVLLAAAAWKFPAAVGLISAVGGRVVAFGVAVAWFIAAGSLVAAFAGILVVIASRIGRVDSSPPVGSVRRRVGAHPEYPSEIVTVADGSGRISYQSPSAARLLGHVPGFWFGRNLSEFVHIDDDEKLREILAEVATGQPLRGKTAGLTLRRGDGSGLSTETILTPLYEDGRLVGVVLASRDLSVIRPLARVRAESGNIDELTGLPDRAALQAHLTEALQSTQCGQVAVAEIDLDGFAALNETLGREFGDEILRQVARALRRCVRPWDIVARVGGDEFSVLVAGTHAERSVTRVHDRLRRALDSVVIGDGREVRLGFSAGYAVNDAGTESAEELMRNTELALARARTAHRIDILRFEAPMRVALQSRVRAEQELRAALAGRQLELAFQPMVSLADGRIHGAEALVRWRHPERGLISAGEFIPLAEQMRVVHELGLWALRRACRELRDLRSVVPELGPFALSVNVSAHQLGPELVRQVASASADAGVAATDLVLEVTESVLAGRPDEAAETLSSLRALGCRVALDDFGTGYSSLAYLARFPVDIIKIDRSFVAGMCDDPQQLALTRTIVALGNALRLRTVAEGVETDEQAELLRALGCERAQGYWFGRPVPMAELIESIKIGRLGTAVAAPRSSVEVVDQIVLPREQVVLPREPIVKSF
ncbi:MAG: EAL domain-containing protein [Candidatus Nanopelagicales bacterium]|nr:EAL domain-containing protein [Candidatus Nanopelagicales bacterium]